MTYLLVWVAASFILAPFVGRLLRGPRPVLRVVDLTESEGTESTGEPSSTNEVWDGADPTGPAPSP